MRIVYLDSLYWDNLQFFVDIIQGLNTSNGIRDSVLGRWWGVRGAGIQLSNVKGTSDVSTFYGKGGSLRL